MARQHVVTTRRNFLKGAAAFATVSLIPRHVLGGDGQTAASDKLTHGIVGVGGMGSGHVDYVLSDKQGVLLAVCDVDRGHLDAAVKKGRGCKGFRDFREMLDMGGIDVVHVPTPPHWHALVSIAALDAGCDVWSEKPMTRTIAEGQYVIDAVKRNGRVFRINTWFRLNGGFYGFNTEVKPIKKLVMSGLLGWPLTVRVGPFTGFGWKLDAWVGRVNARPEPIPPAFDYDLWLGPAPYKPYFAHRTHGTFRGYWDYDGGGLGDMGQHYLDPVQYLLNKDDTSPVEIEASAPWPPHPDACGVWGWVKMRYADGCEIILDSGCWGDPITKGLPYIEGPKGKLYPNLKTDPPELADKVKFLPDPPPQISDFNVSVRTRQKFGLNEVNAHRSCTLINLANIAIRTGRKLQFDPVTMRFPNDEEANRRAYQPMRAPWHL